MLVLTRSEVLDVGVSVTVAEITTSMSGLAAEGPIDHTALGFDGESVIHCDGLHTVPRSRRPRSSLQRAAKPCSESVGQGAIPSTPSPCHTAWLSGALSSRRSTGRQTPCDRESPAVSSDIRTIRCAAFLPHCPFLSEVSRTIEIPPGAANPRSPGRLHAWARAEGISASLSTSLIGLQLSLTLANTNYQCAPRPSELLFGHLSVISFCLDFATAREDAALTRSVIAFHLP